MPMEQVLKIISEMAHPVKFGNAGGSRNPFIGASVSKRLTEKNPFGTRPFLETLSARLAREGFEVDGISRQNYPSKTGRKYWYKLIARKSGTQIIIETSHSVGRLKNAIRLQHNKIKEE
ncbi:MAG: hypothetical protein Q8R15_00260 [Candidatus Micrarchaeota archaeon]|nr:hypothetical protein [Candidatus Micrarchaeota archaeon]